MSKTKSVKRVVLSAIGLILFAAGLVLLKSFSDLQGLWLSIPYFCIGIGSGLFGHNLGEILKQAVIKKDPQTARQIEIEARDERNNAISNRAKAKAYDVMLIVFAAVLWLFAFMQAVDLAIILSLVAAYLFIVFTNIYFLNKYQKEM